VTDEELAEAERLARTCQARIASHWTPAQHLTFYMNRLLDDCWGAHAAVWLLRTHVGLSPMHVSEEGFEMSHAHTSRFIHRCTTKMGGKDKWQCFRDELSRGYRCYAYASSDPS